MSAKYNQIRDLLQLKTLPSHNELFQTAEKACSVLENEITDYRTAATNGEAGSLLDFRARDLPTVVIPDLHARPFFLLDILNYRLPLEFTGDTELSVFEALEKKRIRIVCVGDALHTEYGTRERWCRALEEFDNEIFTGENMVAEMVDGLSLICALMKLKEFFPENFHFLKGNHENMLNACCDGDFAFRKYADEGNMVRTFITEYYGEDVLYMLACTESALPLIFINGKSVISHAEPAREFSRNQLINARCECKVVEGLTWTDNGAAEEDTAKKIIRNLTENENIEDYVYLGGHRPVRENYSLRQNGMYIQIHNPAKENIALVYQDKKFSPEENIVSVIKKVESGETDE